MGSYIYNVLERESFIYRLCLLVPGESFVVLNQHVCMKYLNSAIFLA